ncbi:conserved oligomeric Golgi complex subunit 7 [Dermatophagoides pteronyssinus]|uniref:Conserved oligomeric Golgi complex subunit 7 n=1 Tax=Dermatophagoides pteronyssinus TaxID=6956 RepID=A0A6P6XSI5_DERPT|nr:conserved oligomeric Golgi complex subunit 7-like isoform X1 [Dermatophagoides pteronyssinus]
MDNIDFSAFSQDTFDPVQWLNSIFSSTDDDDSSTGMDKKSIANNLVFKLQLMVEETNHSLQENSIRMSYIMPKVMDEADVLNQEVKELRDQIVDVRTKLICSEQKHADVFESLMKMDHAKQQLQDLYQALQEANNWSVLSMDVDEVFESGNVEQISSKILNMQKSLQLLSLSSSSDGNQLTDKIEMLENLKDRFEKLVEPILMDAFVKSLESSIEYFTNLFKEFQRSDRLIKYYHSCLRDQLLKEWSTQVKLDSDGTVLDKLNFLYDRINMIWKIQMNFCMKVIYTENFGMSLQILCDIFTDIIISLQPPIDTFIYQFLNQMTNGQRLYRQKSLIELKQFTNSFVKNLEQNISAQQYSTDDDLNDKTVKSLDIFLRTIYQPFAKLNESFILYEKERLDDEFDDIRSEYDDIINIHCVLKLFSIVRDSYKLYSDYIETYPLLIVEDVIEDILLKYLNSTNDQKQCWSLSNIVVEDTKKTNSTSLPNWSYLQKMLFKFQTYGDFVSQFNGFQQQIHTNFLEYQKNYQQQQQQPNAINIFRRYDLLILNLDYNVELCNRIQNFIQSPSILMNQVLNECVDLIKINAKDIDLAMFNYVEIQLKNFDILIEKFLAEYNVDNTTQEELNDSITYTPNEYVTQIGQYLLLLPQHLEPFNLNENHSFKIALQFCTDIFRYCPNESLAPTELLLEFVQRKTIQAFLDHIQNISSIIKSNKRISKLPTLIRKQITVDLQYLSAVCEDLGLINLPEAAVICIQIFNQQPESWPKLKKENSVHQKLITILEDIL